MPVRRPHQAAYWQVTLPIDADLRPARRRWCRSNIAAVPGRINWIAPSSLRVTDSWSRPDGLGEIWHFAQHEDAVMFEMVWKDYL
jgi:hypothetical protein